ncbi:MAG: glycosyltransferase [Caldimonas sp.]
MRIVIDMQGAQTESRFRGIGRYSLALTQAIVRNRGGHQVVLALNGLFPESVDSIRAAFDDLLPQSDIRVWSAPGPVREADPANRPRRQAAERIREAFLLDLRPDVVLMTSLFEGLGDDAVTSAGVWAKSIPTAAILYDLIPLISPDISFRTSKIHQDWLAEKVASLRRCRLLLAISESSRQEAIGALPVGPEHVVNVWGACDAAFVELGLTPDDQQRAREQAGVQRPFVMYTGGADERKNLPRLIEAFATLPADLRSKYQLAFVGKMPAEHVGELRAQAAALGLPDQVVFTGYVEDAALVRLYNSCALFIFPSLHEGLGLPPMEAMACGAPVITADATSLPEVVGLPEALFDPRSVAAIAEKLKRGLADELFRARLIAHGRHQSRKFSWDESGRRSVEALARFAPASPAQVKGLRFERTSRFPRRRLRILVQKLDHRGDLVLAIPAIAKLRARYPDASLEALVGSWNEPMARDLKLFEKIHVLDFFRSASANAPAYSNADLDALASRLGRYDIAIDLRRQADTRFIVARIDAARRVGYQTFDAAIDARLDIRLDSYPDVPFESTPLNRIHASEQMLQLVDALPTEPGDYVALPSLVGPVKRTDMQVALFPVAGNDVKQWAPDNFIGLARRLAATSKVDRVNVYFGSAGEAASFPGLVGPGITVHAGLAFGALATSLAQNSVCVANNSFGAHIAGYLGCLVIGVYGGHETAAEWSPPFGESYVLHAGVACSPCHIAAVGDCPYGLVCLSSIALDVVFEKVEAACAGEPERGGPAFAGALAEMSSAQIVDDLLGDLSMLDGGLGGARQRVNIAECLSRNHRVMSSRRQILVDVSQLVRHDAKSGIQRVVRAVLGQLLAEPPMGYAVEPVYLPDDRSGFSYARAFKQQFLGRAAAAPEHDLPAEAWPGDIFVGLDLHPGVSSARQESLDAWRRRGVKVCFVVYDLLPVVLPDAFSRVVVDAHQRWLEYIARFDGVIAISKAVADEFMAWLQYHGPARADALRVGWFHLGHDISTSAPSTGLPKSAEADLATMALRTSFLMVGTLEPRKGHGLVLAAFELLWRRGIEANLVIVGRPGWIVDELAARLRSHPQNGARLFWLEDASDEYLERVYARASALIAASVGEGFGLPLVEAARHGLPIVARDIPVFREVAGDGAHYFAADIDAAGLADRLRDWLDRFAAGEHPRSDRMTTITWKQSTQQLLNCLTGDSWAYRWRPDGIRRFEGADSRLHSAVGERRGRAIHSSGKGGHLIFGPYIALPTGRYRLRLWGQAARWSRRDWFDLVHDAGRVELFRGGFGEQAPGAWQRETDFMLAQDIRDFEVRLWVAEDTIASLEGMQISPLGAEPGSTA